MFGLLEEASGGHQTIAVRHYHSCMYCGFVISNCKMLGEIHEQKHWCDFTFFSLFFPSISSPLVQVKNCEIVEKFIQYQPKRYMIFSNCPKIYQNLPSLFNLRSDETVHVNLCKKNCAIDPKKNNLYCQKL